jgi:hypothetical protein
MADGVNPTMNAVQTAGVHPGGAALAVNAQPLELGEGDDTVLVRCQASDRGVRGGVGEFCMHGYA